MHAKKISIKALVLLLAVVMLIGCTVGSTFAWLIATSDPVTNTFAVGNINIELKEHTLDANGTLTQTETDALDIYKVLPGTAQSKDPFVRVKADSENCWVFVQIKESNNSATENLKYVTWSVADGWTLLETANGVSTYYRTVNYATSASAQTYPVLTNNEVTYSSNLTKAMLDALGTAKPTLTLKAFAVQEGAAATATAAWAEIASSEKLS